MMSETSFSHLNVNHVDGVAVVDFINADIVYASTVVEEIGKELRGLLSEQSLTKVLLNFKDVQYVSSSMLGQLVHLQKDADATRSQLKLVGLGPTLKDIFHIGHFDRIFEIHDDQATAMASFH
jgi:anti-sigma B factor antagonist